MAKNSQWVITDRKSILLSIFAIWGDISKKKSASRRTSKRPDVRDRPVRPMRQDTTATTHNVHNAWSITFASYGGKMWNCVQNAYWINFASRSHTELSLCLECKLMHNCIIWKKNEELRPERILKYLYVQNANWSTNASRTHTEAQLHLQFTHDHDGPPDAHDAYDAITAKLYQ